MKKKNPISLSKIFLYVFLTFGAVIMVFPFYWMITGAFKTNLEVQSIPPVWFPTHFSLDNFKEALHMAPFARYFLNSLIAMVCTVTLCTFTTILGAFAFSKLHFPGRNIIFGLLLGLMMVPFTSSIFYMYILKGFFDSVPDTLYQAARVDGCSNWKYLWRILVPIAKPSLVTIILLNAIACWNSFLWPMLAISDRELRTLPFGLYAFVSEGGAKTELMMSASTIIVIPMIILFLFARKQIVNGVSRGGLKG